jgi:lipopolysaccharide export system protein LptA
MVRWLTAISIFVVVVGVVSLAVVRARRMQVPIGEIFPPVVPPTEYGDPGKAVIIQEGTKTFLTEGGRHIFILSSLTTLGTESGWNEIEGVTLELFQEDGQPVVVSCKSASYNSRTRDTRLRGSVHIQFPNGSFVETDRGYFDSKARVFHTEGKATFSGGGGIGEAGRVLYYLERDQIVLDRGVEARFLGGDRLEAPRVVRYQKNGVIVLPDGCRLTTSGILAEAGEGRLEAKEKDGDIAKFALTRGVVVKGRDVGGSAYIEFIAKRLSGVKDAGNNWQVSAWNQDSWVELSLYEGPGYMYRRIRTWDLRAVVSTVGIQRLVGRQSVCLLDIPEEGPSRTAVADRGVFRMLERLGLDISLEGNVEIFNEIVQASGARADYSGDNGVMIVTGERSHGRRVALASGRGELTCDEVQIDRESGRAEARGRVQGYMDRAQLLGADEREGAGRLHFAADKLVVDENGKRFHLRDDARAWQGDQLLLADEIIHQYDNDSLRAFGHVRTTFPAPSTDEGGASGGEVLVVARSLDYSKSETEALAKYTGNVRFTDSGHTMSAAEVRVFFDENNKINLIEAEGAVDLLDVATGRRMKGQNATRDMATQIVTVLGNPVQLSDEKGNQVTGISLTWNQADGSVRVRGDDESPTETLIRAEEKR